MTAVPPDTLRVQTAENVSLGYATAGLGSRMAAQLIDNVFAGLLVFVVFLAYAAIAHTASTSLGNVTGVLAAVAFTTFTYFGYFLVCEAVSGGRTPGKSALGLRVIRIDGSAPDFTAILVRNIVRIVDFAFGIGILVAFFHPLARRLGDIAAGTVVVRQRTPLTLAAVTTPPPVLLRTPDAGPTIDGIERLGSKEYDAVRMFLSRPGLSPDLRQRLAADIAGRLFERLGLGPAAPERFWPAELFLERLYLQLDSRLR